MLFTRARIRRVKMNGAMFGCADSQSSEAARSASTVWPAGMVVSTRVLAWMSGLTWRACSGPEKFPQLLFVGPGNIQPVSASATCWTVNGL